MPSAFFDTGPAPAVTASPQPQPSQTHDGSKETAAQAKLDAVRAQLAQAAAVLSALGDVKDEADDSLCSSCYQTSSGSTSPLSAMP